MARARAKRALFGARRLLRRVAPVTVDRYWARRSVTHHHPFKTAAESLEYFHWRNAQYFGYIEAMPVDRAGGKVVLDYGCGPGHDLVGFGVYSGPERLIGIDVSRSSLDEAGARLALHGIDAELVLIDQDSPIPLDDASVDWIHCSGVLHHVRDPLRVLGEFRRVLRPGGEARVMVYNYDSVFLHMQVAYVVQIERRLYSGASVLDAFRRSTDGDDCPISHAYRPAEFAGLCADAGLEAELVDVAVSVLEASLTGRRFEAIKHRALPAEHREFLAGLTLDERGLPRHRGRPAGVDACYRLVPG